VIFGRAARGDFGEATVLAGRTDGKRRASLCAGRDGLRHSLQGVVDFGAPGSYSRTLKEGPMPRFTVVAIASLAALFALACGSESGTNESDRGAIVIPACNWPASANTLTAESETGCLPRSMFQICGVPSGSVVHADGSITTPEGETVACTNACSPTEYSLECRGTGSTGAAVPAPDPALSCRAIPVPTPPNLVFHCCPCHEDRPSTPTPSPPPVRNRRQQIKDARSGQPGSAVNTWG